MPAGGIIAGVGSLAGGLLGSRAQGQATDAAVQSEREAINAQLAMFNQSRADQMPLIQARNAALPTFMQLLGLNFQIPQSQQPAARPMPRLEDFGTGPLARNRFIAATRAAMNQQPPSLGGVQANIVGAQNNDRTMRTHFLDQLGIPGVGSIDSPLDTLRTPFNNFGDWDGSNMANNLGEMQFSFSDMPAATNMPAQQVAPIDLNALIAATPGYQFRLGEGLRALDRSAAARGGLQSGATLRAAQRYGEGLAANEFGDYSNRLASLIGLGQTAATTAGGFGQQTGANIGQGLSNIGAARASGYANQGNIWGNAIGGLANAFGQYYNQRPSGGVSFGSGPYDSSDW